MTQEEQIVELEKQIGELTKSLSAKDEIICAKENLLSKQDEIISEKIEIISNLESRLAWFRKQVFGSKSEKNLPVDPNALLPSLFDDLLTEEDKANIAADAAKLDAEITDALTVEKHTRKKREHHRTLDTSKLEIRTLPTIEPEGINLADYVEIDRDISDRLVYVAATMYIERSIRPRYALKSHLQIKNPEKKVFEIGSLPTRPLPKCIASSSILTEIVIQKFQYHLPFYRIIQKFKEFGLGVSDSTIGDWYAATCAKLKPIYDLHKEQVFQSDYIQVDESTLRVIDNENKRTQKGYIWVVRDAIGGGVFFHYDHGSRSNDTAKALLGAYQGAIQADGYVSYDQFEESPGKMLLGCLVHARRKFADSLSNNKTLASEGLLFFSKLYEIERQGKEEKLTAKKITQLRKEKAYPILQLFEKWLIDNYNKVLPSSPIGKAISYTYSLLPRLSRYVTDGKYNPDNNLVESTIRPLAVGRKNWLHAGSPASATRAAMMYSFIGSCKAAGVEPHKWFAYVLDNLSRYQEESLDITELLPMNWKPEDK